MFSWKNLTCILIFSVIAEGTMASPLQVCDQAAAPSNEFSSAARTWAKKFPKQISAWSIAPIDSMSELVAFKSIALRSNSVQLGLQSIASAKAKKHALRMTNEKRFASDVTEEGLKAIERLLKTQQFESLKGDEGWCVFDWTANSDTSLLESRIRFLDDSVKFTFSLKFRFVSGYWRLADVSVAEV